MVSHLTSQNQPDSSHLSVQLPDRSAMEDLSQTPAEVGNPALSHLDWSYLHRLSDADHDFEMRLLELFLQDCQEHLEPLKQAIARSDLKRIETLAHYIKGASANIGAHYMEYCAQQIEQQVRHTQLTCFEAEMRRLETSFTIVQDIFAAQQEAR